MASSSSEDGALLKWYRNRIAEPTTDDEVYGYWLFVFGVVIGLFGVLLAGSTATQTSGSFQRLAGIALGGLGLLFVLIGPIVRLPLERRATRVAYVGAAISVLAIVWLVLSFDGGRGQRSIVFGTYGIGMAVIALGAILVPMMNETDGETAVSAAESSAQPAQTDPDSARTEADEHRAEADDLREQVAARTDELAVLHDSAATFELYEDRGGKYRWRLRHRNSNIIADSAQGYSRRVDAQNGIESVRRNALGGALVELETEIDDSTDEAETGVVAYPPGESKATFELYEDNAGGYRWRLQHANGNIIADSGEGYTERREAEAAIERVSERAGPAQYLRADPTAFEVYQDAAEEWRWRLIHKNGKILADSGEGSASRSGARDAVDRVRSGLEDDDYEFEIYEDTAGKYRWRLEADNGEIVADSGQGFSEERGARESIDRVEGHAPDAAALDIGLAAFEVFEDNAGQYRWRLRHRNGNILADGGQGYSSRTKAFDGIDSVKRNAPNAETTDA
ncbi:DUF1508 domain-containing protein [Halomicrobium mukohataei]|uniref:DUF1508 domain-containing protein n=1 Tax=Halomicrobium mukohataei TaxID=57705 RepID=A0A847UGY4_9EURY|nr:YegP family protein [Halomicrobium mukohataei]NLV10358.1 DUF1508 domain-containing protein [Halomicrobium mukohataei]